MKTTYIWLGATVATFIVLLSQLAAYTGFVIQGFKLFVAALFILGGSYLVTLFIFKAKKSYIQKSDLYAAALIPALLGCVILFLIYVGFVVIG